MSTRTYTRTYRAEVTETITFSDEDLTPEQVAVLNDHDRGFVESLHGDVLDIVGEFDADHEEIAHVEDLTIERTR